MDNRMKEMMKEMMKTMMVTTLTTGICMGAAMARATGGGNGGDIIECLVNGKKTYRTLDSVVMETQPFFSRVEGRNSEKALEDIIEKFNKTMPRMALKLSKFLESFENKVDGDSKVFWIDAKLYDVQDENLYVRIPDHCSEELIQAVVLVKKPFKRYYYDSEALKLIEDEGDELSWLIIHEWLRDFIDDSDVIRVVNSFIHSGEFLRKSESEMFSAFKGFGFTSGLGDSYSELQAELKYLRENKAYFENELERAHLALDEAQRRGDTSESSEYVKRAKAIKYDLFMKFGISCEVVRPFTKEFDELVSGIRQIERRIKGYKQ